MRPSTTLAQWYDALHHWVRSRSPLSFFHSPRSGPTEAASKPLPTAPSRRVSPQSAASNHHEDTSGNRSESIPCFNILVIPADRTHQFPEVLLRNPRFLFATNSVLTADWNFQESGSHSNTAPIQRAKHHVASINKRPKRNRRLTWRGKRLFFRHAWTRLRSRRPNADFLLCRNIDRVQMPKEGDADRASFMSPSGSLDASLNALVYIRSRGSNDQGCSGMESPILRVSSVHAAVYGRRSTRRFISRHGYRAR